MWDPYSVTCPLCGGGEPDADCELCGGTGVLGFDDANKTLPAFRRCRDCGGPVEARDGSDGRRPAWYCDPCALLEYE